MISYSQIQKECPNCQACGMVRKFTVFEKKGFVWDGYLVKCFFCHHIWDEIINMKWKQPAKIQLT